MMAAQGDGIMEGIEAQGEERKEGDGSGGRGRGVKGEKNAIIRTTTRPPTPPEAPDTRREHNTTEALRRGW